MITKKHQDEQPEQTNNTRYSTNKKKRESFIFDDMDEIETGMEETLPRS
jgi:hypothetical protein